jgi:UDP-glucuronate 4-epimerase
MTIVVTGAAGFIGAHVARRLLQDGRDVIGIDNFEPYYNVDLKHDRLAWVRDAAGSARFAFHQVDIADDEALDTALAGAEITGIVHLAAQAGVRYSLTHPRKYIRANVAGHLNMLEIARARPGVHMVYASSSSVYGANTSVPFRLEDRVDHPVSLYAATKRADELMSETYAHLYRLPQTGLRFFTVYGPWGRPDMAAWLFTDAILKREPIKVFNRGDMMRDFTFIDDIVAGVVGTLDHPPRDDGLEKPGGSVVPHARYNIGNSHAERLEDLITTIEAACGMAAIRDYQPMQPGDVPATFADISAIERDIGFRPATSIETGIPRFVDWFRAYHGV